MPLGPDDWLYAGTQYTFTVSETFNLGLTMGLDEVNSRLFNLPGVGNLIATKSQDLFSAPTYNITFMYGGDSDSVSSMAASILAALQSWANTWVLVGANEGASGTPLATTGSATTTGLKAAISDLTPSTTAIVAIVIGLGLVVFLASGGAGLVRRASGA